MTNLSFCLARASSGQNTDIPVLLKTEKPIDIPENHILLSVDRFGWSANNVTYQALGESPHFRYFDFHGVPEFENVSSNTHGLVPVWGFATVVASQHPGMRVGERLYGYLAPCRYLLLPIATADINKFSCYVPRPHLPADRRPYNQLIRCSENVQYDPSPEIEDLTMLYRPLFWTSYWCEDWLNSTSYRGGSKRVVISSASSKTAFCLAYLIRKRSSGTIKVIGLTSKGNIGFSKGLSLYDEVVEYSTVESASAVRAEQERWIYIDIAGNAALNTRLVDHFSTTKQTLVTTVALGMTNLAPSSPKGSKLSWDTNTFGNDSAAPTAPVEQFFMVEWLNVRKHQLRPQQIFELQNKAWRELLRDCRDWVQIERVNGGEAVKKAYERSVKGGLGPDKGFIWSLWDAPAEVLRPKL